MRTIILAVMLAGGGAVFTAPVAAQPAVTNHGGVIFTTATPQAVIASRVSVGHQMLFVRQGFQVLSATSTNLSQWGGLQTGVRLSTSSDVTTLDASSITACGVQTSTTTGFMRMFYVGISTSGRYQVLSATSTDGLFWGKEAGLRLRVNNGAGFIDSPKPWIEGGSGSVVRLYYIADSAGGNSPANYRIFSASSTDGGLTFTAEGQVLATNAYQLSVSSLTDGRRRLWFTSPLSPSTTATQLLSAISNDGLTFALESGVRLSTDTSSSLTHPVVVRATDTWKWRLYNSYTDTASTHPYISSGTAQTPLITGVSPSIVLQTTGPTLFTVTGEIFSPTNVQATFYQGAATITWTTEATVTDRSFTGTGDPTGRSTGFWYATATNSDGFMGTMANALLIDVAPGSVQMTDNLFRPLQGGKVTIGVRIFEAGDVRLRVYTQAGDLVATLYDGAAPIGNFVVQWDGRNSTGGRVASGVYLLRATGPKLNATEKIVLIK